MFIILPVTKRSVDSGLWWSKSAVAGLPGVLLVTAYLQRFEDLLIFRIFISGILPATKRSVGWTWRPYLAHRRADEPEAMAYGSRHAGCPP
jgi:hypothetical protein